MNGILLIDKPSCITSRDVVNQVSKKFDIKKVGHTGTLDPIATGVLVLCVGEATKAVELLTAMDKEYIAEVMLGVETDTLDITGKVLNEEKVDLEKNKIINVLNSFKGRYYQEVPIYSAVKVKGKKLYEYARNGENIELPKRLVSINSIELIDDLYLVDNHLCFKFKCSVSKGTYIRSLIKDICDCLNIKGTMLNLRRIKQGKFSIDNCININEVDNSKLLSLVDVLDIPKIEVNEFLKHKIINGQILENRYESDKVMFTYNGDLLAIYQVYSKDSSKIKPYKMFGGIK
jgi:tRNA pseudouridine55 synthase